MTEISRREASARARQRKANAALDLKTSGMSWEEIAETLGYPDGAEAQKSVELTLEKEVRESTAGKEMMRQMVDKRLERLLHSLWPKAIDPDNPEHLNAVQKAAQLLAQHSKLFGLDAPTEHVVYSPAAEEIQQWVATVVSKGAPELEEADIFEIEGEVVSVHDETGEA